MVGFHTGAGDPTAALAAPGRCQLGDDWTPCALRDRVWVSDDTMVATFDLPDASAPLGLSTCACVLARGGAGDDGEPVVRPYTPVSTNALVGAFQVMVKVYERGTLSRALAALAVAVVFLLTSAVPDDVWAAVVALCVGLTAFALPVWCHWRVERPRGDPRQLCKSFVASS